jgi:hypothetical protein
MSKSIKEIAEEALPGWRVAKPEKRERAAKPRAQVSTPSLKDLRRRYLGEEAAAAHEGFQSASHIEAGSAEYVEMVPKGAEDATQRRRVVIVSKGRAVAIQG